MFKAFIAGIVAAYFAFVGAFHSQDTAPKVNLISTSTAAVEVSSSTTLQASSSISITSSEISDKQDETPQPQAPKPKPVIKQTTNIEVRTTQAANASIPVAETDYTDSVVAVLRNEKNSYQDLRDWLTSSLELFDLRIQDLNNKISSTRSIPTYGNGNSEQISQAFIDEYTTDITTTSQYKNQINSLIATTDGNINLLITAADTNAGTKHTQKDLLYVLDKMKEYDAGWETVKDSGAKTIQNFNSYTSGEDNTYRQAYAMLEADVSSAQSAPPTINYYVPAASQVPVLPTFTPPQTTRCTISGDGGVGLEAYINCTTQ